MKDETFSTLPSDFTETLAPDDRHAPRALIATPQLYLVFSCDQPLRSTSRHSLRSVDVVSLGRGGGPPVQRLTQAGERVLQIRCQDRWMSSGASGSHARLARAGGRWMIEDAGSKNGTMVNGQPVTRGPLADGDLIEAGHTFFLFREAVETGPDDAEDLDSAELAPPAFGLSTLVPWLQREFDRLLPAARSREEIVLSGDGGTGKEVVARAIHELSGRGGAFVAINCGAMPEALVESELFGHRKGAFSDAREDRPGLVRSAEKGTLFLDEIGDLPLASQVKFLRVLQERVVTPVGEVKPVPVDIRLVAATNRDLGKLVADGRFRSDLFARISGFTVRMPPLAERREDFGLLTAELLRQVEGHASVRFTNDAVRAMLRYHFPHNVRGLLKTVRTASVLAATHAYTVEVEDLPRELQAAVDQAPDVELEPEAEPEQLSDEDQQRREQILALLAQHGGNVTAVARRLGKARMQVQRWTKRYRIDVKAYRKGG